jgi:hypothetical protein
MSFEAKVSGREESINKISELVSDSELQAISASPFYYRDGCRSRPHAIALRTSF